MAASPDGGTAARVFPVFVTLDLPPDGGGANRVLLGRRMGVRAQVARGLEGDKRGEDREQHGNEGYLAQTCPGKTSVTSKPATVILARTMAGTMPHAVTPWITLAQHRCTAAPPHRGHCASLTSRSYTTSRSS